MLFRSRKRVFRGLQLYSGLTVGMFLKRVVAVAESETHQKLMSLCRGSKSKVVESLCWQKFLLHHVRHSNRVICFHLARPNSTVKHHNVEEVAGNAERLFCSRKHGSTVIHLKKLKAHFNFASPVGYMTSPGRTK